MAIADPDTADAAPGAKFDILGQGEIIPAAHFLQQFLGKAKTCAGNSTCKTKAHTGLAQMAGIVQIPNAVTCGDPGRTEVLGIAVAGESLVAFVTKPVHLTDIIRHQHIVSIEDHIGVEIVPTVIFINFCEQMVQCIALTYLFLIEALIHDSAGLTGDLGSGIGAVICHHKSGDLICRILLVADAVKQMADNLFFISGGNQDRI